MFDEFDLENNAAEPRRSQIAGIVYGSALADPASAPTPIGTGMTMDHAFAD